MTIRRWSALLSSAAIAGAVGLAMVPAKAQAWWLRVGGPGFVVAPPPVVYAPPPPVYVAPYGPAYAYAPRPYYPHRAWIPGHYRGPYWVPGHWA